MKPHQLFVLAIAVATPSTWAAGGSGAKEAVRAFANAKGSHVMTNIVSISGTRGQDQPQVWRIVAQDGQARRFQEYYLQGGRIVSQGPVSGPGAATTGGHAIPQRKFRVDSTAAFSAVEKSARAARVGYDSADYDLRCLELSDRPVWFITLWNHHGAKVGDVSVNAESGAILRKQYYAPGIAPTQQVAGNAPVQPRPQAQAAPGQPYPQQYTTVQPAQSSLWGRTKSGATKGAILVKDTVTQATGKVKGLFNRAIGRPAQPEYIYGQTAPQQTGYGYPPQGR